MKTLFLFVSLLFINISFSQKPEKVYSVVKELRSVDWYKTQADLWEKETKKNPKNAEAWYYYYSATRALKNTSWGDTVLLSKYKKACSAIANDAYKAVPNSFEANHLIWWDSGNDITKFSYLEKAYKIDPLDIRTYRDLMIHYVFKFDAPKVKEFADKIFNVNEMPASAYNWAYNLLAEAEPNAIIFTAGDNDTYLPWIVQEVFNFRKDVTIMNTSLINKDDYRTSLFKKIGLKPFDKTIEDAKSEQDAFEIRHELFEHIFDQDDKFPVYVASTAIQQFENKYNSKLYVVGLNYKYCENSVDNLAIIKRNYEKRYLLNYLDFNFSFHSLAKKANDFDVYYLQAFIKLHKHYLKSEDIYKAERLKDQIMSIAKRGNQEENLKDWINEYNK